MWMSTYHFSYLNYVRFSLKPRYGDMGYKMTLFIRKSAIDIFLDDIFPLIFYWNNTGNLCTNLSFILK